MSERHLGLSGTSAGLPACLGISVHYYHILLLCARHFVLRTPSIEGMPSPPSPYGTVVYLGGAECVCKWQQMGGAARAHEVGRRTSWAPSTTFGTAAGASSYFIGLCPCSARGTVNAIRSAPNERLGHRCHEARATVSASDPEACTEAAAVRHKSTPSCAPQPVKEVVLYDALPAPRKPYRAAEELAVKFADLHTCPLCHALELQRYIQVSSTATMAAGPDSGLCSKRRVPLARYRP